MDGCAEDVPGLAHWWSNCLHLRWMLWAMCRGDDDGSPDEFDWVMQVWYCCPWCGVAAHFV